MSEKSIPERGHSSSFRDTIHNVFRQVKSEHGAKKSESSPAKPKAVPSTGRPIERVLVGAWNAAKPESQGKAIMKIVDRWFHPTYKTEEERKRAARLRPNIEKAVGWTAVTAEAALITFGVVKGYQTLRTMDWSKFRKEKSFQRRSAHAPRVVVQSDAAPTQLADLQRGTVPSRRIHLLSQGEAADHRMFRAETIVPVERIPYMKELLPTMTALAERIKANHGLVDEEIVLALARAQCGFLGRPTDLDKEAKLLAYLGEWIDFGAGKNDPEILYLRRLLPNPNTWAFPAPDPAVPLEALEKLFAEYHRKQSFLPNRPDKVGAFARWANIGFPALDTFLGLRGPERVHGEQRMQELYEAWKNFGWLLKGEVMVG